MGDATARDVVEMLRRHYLPKGRPAGGVLAVEIEAPGGHRRADAIWAPLTISGGAGLVGHEIKVARSDVIAELSDPTKCEPWLRYCSQWYLTVSDPALVEGLDVPEAWGIMAPPSGRRRRSMTILRQAPLRKVEDGPGWRRIAAWDHWHMRDKIIEAQHSQRYLQQDVERLRKELRDARSGEWVRQDPDAAKIKSVLMKVRESTGMHTQPDMPFIFTEDLSVEEIARAILDAAATRKAAESVRRELDSLITLTDDPLARARKQLIAIQTQIGATSWPSPTSSP